MPRLPSPSYFLQLFWGNSKVFPSQPKHSMSRGLFPLGHVQETLTYKASRGWSDARTTSTVLCSFTVEELNCSLTLVSQISIIICISSPHFLKCLFCSANKTVQGKSSCTGGWKTAGRRSNVFLFFVFFKNHKWDPAFCHSSCSTLQ